VSTGLDRVVARDTGPLGQGGRGPGPPLPAAVDRWDLQGGWFFPHPPFERLVVEEDERTVLYVNHEGILLRERKDNPLSSMPQFVRFPVSSREDFVRFRRERFRPDLAARIGADYARTLGAYRERDFPLVVISDRWGGFFGGLRGMVAWRGCARSSTTIRSSSSR